MKEKTIFSSADILLPVFSCDSAMMTKWSVIACDQFTSDMSYWEKCRNIIENTPSTYNYILPEAYLGKDFEEAHKESIRKNMQKFDASSMQTVNGLIYVERTLPNGSVRHGIVGKIDLEEYDYAPGSKSAIRATEQTVIERIPPRCAVRAAAAIELPHILVLIDDKSGVIEKAAELSKNSPVAYDFDLMLGGGHVKGYSLTDENLSAMIDKIAEYEESAGSVVYAMGDGNHSLASAKALWEQKKAEGAEHDDPARYALCEITALEDDSLVFEPIYRIIKHVDTVKFMEEFAAVASAGKGEQTVTAFVSGTEKTFSFKEKTHALTVGTLQIFIDEYLKNHPEAECDYIHGEDVLRRLASEENTVGFLMDGMDKNDLFGYVDAHGTLPRKTFSMGEAESKRYYLEARKIIK